MSILDILFLWKGDGYLRHSGWINSVREGLPVDKDSNPIPWMTYPAIRFLANRIHAGMMVFEYGCGNSTLWWAAHVNKVVSCEHERKWYENMKSKIPENVELHHVELEYGGEYSRKITEYPNAFDIIVIDGRDRINCAKNSIGSLRRTGVIIWDNSDRESYKEGFLHLFSKGYKRIDFEGMGPVNTYGWSTSIFYPENNCLGI